MKIRVDTSSIPQTRWYEYLSRFVFGGATTALAGIIARKWGPTVGGLFLAFPAIFPASATLIERHQKERKQRAGGEGKVRGRRAAALEAAGAGLGCFGLIAFAIVLWKLLVLTPVWMALSSATLAWFVVSVTAWRIWKAW